MTETKPWFLSKTVITSAIAFLAAVLTALGIMDTETGTKAQELLLPLLFMFLRMGNRELA